MIGFGVRSRVAVGGIIVSTLFLACASSGGGRYRRLVITGDEIRADGFGTAYEALTNHREILIFDGRIAFEGGDDRSGLGRDRLEYTVPMLVWNGDDQLTDAITILRRISASDIVVIRLYYASMVPPEYRRPGAEGGVIEITTGR